MQFESYSYQFFLTTTRPNHKNNPEFTIPTNILAKGICVNSKNGEIMAPINQPAETVTKKSESLLF